MVSVNRFKFAALLVGLAVLQGCFLPGHGHGRHGLGPRRISAQTTATHTSMHDAAVAASSSAR
jgi:hypothetical protein